MAQHIAHHPSDEAWVHCHTYGDKRPPILALDEAGSSLTVGVFGTQPPADHLSFARDLLAAVTEFVAATEAYVAACTAAETATVTKEN
jgi:hypothetical protein